MLAVFEYEFNVGNSYGCFTRLLLHQAHKHFDFMLIRNNFLTMLAVFEYDFIVESYFRCFTRHFTVWVSSERSSFKNKLLIPTLTNGGYSLNCG